ncbi:MAG: Gfo/Idh/MocA family oxidoreductase [Planctomycetaceae bacterium]
MASPRRKFPGQVGVGMLAAATSGGIARAAQSDRVTVGIIGPGGMGTSHLKNLAGRDDVEIAWVCDVDRNRLEKAAAHVQDTTGKRPQSSGDLRHVLDDKRVDAVFIATPDHWHGPASILALDAGKHVYVEKPCCHNIREGRLMTDAVARTGRLLQVGTQSRSTDCVREAIQRVHEGQIGEVLVAKAWNSQRRGSIGHVQPSAVPEELDFDTWVGPAKMVPYQKNLLHSVWRWWYDFGCGDIGNDGVHDIDVALWGLAVQQHPERVACFGGKYFFDDDQQFPDTQYAVFEYAPGADGKRRQFVFEQRIWSPYVQEGYENGAAWYGTNGMLICGHTVGWRLYGPKNQLIAERSGAADLVAHHNNFLDAIRGDAPLHADIQAGHLAATVVHLANIAARTGRVLQFDSTNEQISGDDEASALVRRTYRDDHWATPRGASA